MSWSLQHVGHPTTIRQAVSNSFDAAAAGYKGKVEELDVLAAKDRALAALDEAIASGMKCLEPNPHNQAPKGYQVRVSAYGSHSDPEWGLDVSVHLTVVRVPIE